jgi:hypothetical protein
VFRRVLEVALLAGACACAPVLALAQSADPPPPAVAPAAVPAEAATPPASSTPTPPPVPANIIPAGTIVTLVITEPLSSGKSRSGDHFGLKLAEPIVVGGVVLLPAGAVGLGEVIDAKPANIGGRPGRLVLAARFLDSGPPSPDPAILQAGRRRQGPLRAGGRSHDRRGPRRCADSGRRGRIPDGNPRHRQGRRRRHHRCGLDAGLRLARGGAPRGGARLSRSDPLTLKSPSP